jgi:hypothetical protein
MQSVSVLVEQKHDANCTGSNFVSNVFSTLEQHNTAAFGTSVLTTM